MVDRQSILVVEDDASIMELVRFNLRQAGFDSVAAGSGEEALRFVAKSGVGLVILDIMLPGMDGLAVCRVLKSDVVSRAIPVIIVSARGEEADVVRGLELGAEDYITKPFSPRVLVARVKAVLRRSGVGVLDEQEPMTIEDVMIHPGKRELRVGGAAIEVTATEFDILHYLARRRGWVFTRSQLVSAVHGPDYPVTDRSIDVVIAGLRKKLGAGGDWIETVRGVGYRFRDSSSD
jgi:two-component system phosphate regulon response regulator PhoB